VVYSILGSSVLTFFPKISEIYHYETSKNSIKRRTTLSSSGQTIQSLFHIRSSAVESPTYNLALILIIVAAVFAVVFAVSASRFYQKRQTQKAEDPKQRRGKDTESGAGVFVKPELSGDASALVHEMDGQREPQEITERREGPAHELDYGDLPPRASGYVP
jgi:hypothetical protein